MKIKVCGIRTKSNLGFLKASDVDMIGFIFYARSKRNFEDGELKAEDLLKVKKAKVGVFVNESLEKICETVDVYQLDYIQLHGDESPVFCEALKKKNYNLIKAFPVLDELPSDLEEYAPWVDYFLFDTKGSEYGGNGVQFDWSVLDHYHGSTPYLLSGGIGPSDVGGIKTSRGFNRFGVDVNSKFELSPGLKNEKALELFINQIKKTI